MEAAMSNAGLLKGKSVWVRKADLYLYITLMFWSLFECALCALTLPR